MAIFHCTIQVISRADGRSAIAAAAYRSGSNLANEWSGMIANYEKKKGVVYSEIMLPENADSSFSDRETLWNSVEMFERRCDAQLAREIEVGLPRELTLEENIDLLHEYCSQFRDMGMIVDMNVHDKGTGNPHCHIMLTMREMDKEGHWIATKNRDWNEHSLATVWRKSWADVVNDRLEKKGLPNRIDHRSNEARGLDEIPTIHMGPAAMAMERRGIVTEKGEVNRRIKKLNKLIKGLKNNIEELNSWLKALKEVAKDMIEEEKAEKALQSPSMEQLLYKYVQKEMERVQQYGPEFKLKFNSEKIIEVNQAVAKLKKKGIVTLDDFNNYLSSIESKRDATRSKVVGHEKRMKELAELIDHAKVYIKNDSVHKELNSTKWVKKKEAFAEEHRAELTLWNGANRFFHAKGIKTDSLSDSLKAWEKELKSLKKEHDTEYQSYKEVKDEVKALSKIRHDVQSVLLPEKKEQSKQKNKDVER